MNEVVKHKVERSETRLTPSDRPWRIAFPFIHTRRTKRPNGMALEKPRYDATLLAPKLSNDPATCPNYALLAAHCMEAAAKSWGASGWPQGGHWPIQNGDDIPAQKPKPGQPMLDAAAHAAKFAWRRGYWIVEIGNNLEPGPRVAILQGGQAIEIPSQTVNGRTYYKSGDFVVACIHAYTFNTSGKFGCNFGFEGVLFVGEGERIGNAPERKSAAQMFGSVAPGGVPVAASGAAPAYAAPPVVPAAPVAYAPPAVPGVSAPVPLPGAPAYAQPAPTPAAPVPPGAAPIPSMAVAAYPSSPAATGYAPVAGLPPFPTR